MVKENLLKKISVLGVGLALLGTTTACNMDFSNSLVSNYDPKNNIGEYYHGFPFFGEKYEFRVVEHRVIPRDTVTRILFEYRKGSVDAGYHDEVWSFNIRKEILRELNPDIQFNNLPVGKIIKVPYRFKEVSDNSLIDKFESFIDNL